MVLRSSFGDLSGPSRERPGILLRATEAKSEGGLYRRARSPLLVAGTFGVPAALSGALISPISTILHHPGPYHGQQALPSSGDLANFFPSLSLPAERTSDLCLVSSLFLSLSLFTRFEPC